jgi:putative transposase
MNSASRVMGYRRYDSSVKDAIARSRDPNLFPELKIPRMTALYWIKTAGKQPFERADDEHLVQRENAGKFFESPNVISWEAEGKKVFETFKQVYALFGLSLSFKHLRDRSKKKEVIQLVEKLSEQISLKRCLEELGFSMSRWKRWKREFKICSTSPSTFCSQLSIQQLTSTEVKAMQKFVESPDFSHFSVRALHWYAQKTQKLFCSYSTWLKYVREFKWRRARIRRFEGRPKQGVRASGPNLIWHLDLTKIRLLDGTRAYLQAVIDNSSRYVLAWQVSNEYGGLQTAKLLRQAMDEAYRLQKKNVPEVYMDSGRENINQFVSELDQQNFICMVQAQLDVQFSNSMIEAFFRSLKHQHLHYRLLKDLTTLKSESAFYLREHNERMPHSALEGATPLESYTGAWTDADQIRLQKERANAIQERLQVNRSLRCGRCVA